jgi:hypothetical protein
MVHTPGSLTLPQHGGRGNGLQKKMKASKVIIVLHTHNKNIKKFLLPPSSPPPPRFMLMQNTFGKYYNLFI